MCLYYILSFVLVLFVTSSFTSVPNKKNCKNDEYKCTANDRRKIYPNCMIRNKDSSLWCDQSNYTKIPCPDDISLCSTSAYMQTCRSALALFVSDSCLRRLDRNDLEKYPTIEVLKCGENYITKLEANLFIGNKNLTRIDFCRNNIEVIEEGAFKGLSRLQTLNLANNELEDISLTTFHDVFSLRELSLHNNKIAVLGSDVFSGLKNLEILTLTANRIEHIKIGAFSGLGNLRRLHLDENKLVEIEENTFTELYNLEVLTLSYNKIKKWPLFTEMPNLHTLNLAHNLLQEFKSTHIANLSQLQNLSLENNSLTFLPEDLFHQNPNMRYLNFERNFLDRIDRLTFSSLCHLETLILRQNVLKLPHGEWFERVVENNVIFGNDISLNQWNCGCNVLQFEAYLKTLPTTWKNRLQIICESPKQRKGKALDNAMSKGIKQDRKCPTTPPLRSIPCNMSASTESFVRKTEVFTYYPTTEEIVSTTTKLMDTTRVSDETDRFDVGVRMKVEKETPINLVSVIPFVLSILITIILIAIVVYMRKKHNKGKTNYSAGYETPMQSTELGSNRSDRVAHTYDTLDRDRLTRGTRDTFTNLNEIPSSTSSTSTAQDWESNTSTHNPRPPASSSQYSCISGSGNVGNVTESPLESEHYYMSPESVMAQSETTPKCVLNTSASGHVENNYTDRTVEENAHLLTNFPGIRQPAEGESSPRVHRL